MVSRALDIAEPLTVDGDAFDPIGGAGGALVGYGKNAEREELWACMDYLRPGDTHTRRDDGIRRGRHRSGDDDPFRIPAGVSAT
jgi:hypothetical protein